MVNKNEYRLIWYLSVCVTGKMLDLVGIKSRFYNLSEWRKRVMEYL